MTAAQMFRLWRKICNGNVRIEQERVIISPAQRLQRYTSIRLIDGYLVKRAPSVLTSVQPGPPEAFACVGARRKAELKGSFGGDSPARVHVGHGAIGGSKRDVRRPDENAAVWGDRRAFVVPPAHGMLSWALHKWVWSWLLPAQRDRHGWYSGGGGAKGKNAAKCVGAETQKNPF